MGGKIRSPDYEVAYELDGIRKLPKILNYVNSPPSLQSSNDNTSYDSEDQGILPFDYKHYKCEILADFIRNQRGVVKNIQYTTLPSFEDKKLGRPVDE